MILTWIFVISLLAVLGMLALKANQLKNRRKAFAFRVLARYDDPLAEYVAEWNIFLGNLRDRGFVFLKEELPRHSRYFFFLLRRNLKERYENIMPNIRGSRILRKNGNVSAFLKDIAKDRERNGGGRIDGDVVE